MSWGSPVFCRRWANTGLRVSSLRRHGECGPHRQVRPQQQWRQVQLRQESHGPHEAQERRGGEEGGQPGWGNRSSRWRVSKRQEQVFEGPVQIAKLKLIEGFTFIIKVLRYNRLGCITNFRCKKHSMLRSYCTWHRGFCIWSFLLYNRFGRITKVTHFWSKKHSMLRSYYAWPRGFYFLKWRFYKFLM